MLRFLTILLFPIISCNNYPQTSEDVVGRYVSMDENNKSEYLFFSSNKTYEHYKLNKDTLIKAVGTWKFSSKKGTLFLTNWTNFSYSNEIINSTPVALVRINNKRIYFSADNYKRNFEKLE